MRVEEKCGCTVTITSAKVFCSFCNGTGKILREWTEDEKGEKIKILEAISKDVDNMNDRAVRKWLKRCQMAIFLIKGKLHQTGFNPESVSGQPQEMIDKIRIRLEALSEFSTEIAKIIEKYKVAYTGDILNKANSVEDNRKAWEEYFSDRRWK
ncbi:MAG: hypothetical protein DDT22_01124 [candidate division WS2 bacterium]|nr:hypothetical protein [Candidatus Lithacetigena glycinireducens]